MDNAIDSQGCLSFQTVKATRRHAQKGRCHVYESWLAQMAGLEPAARGFSNAEVTVIYNAAVLIS